MPQFGAARGGPSMPQHRDRADHFSIGLFKKIIFADGIAPYANAVFAARRRGAARRPVPGLVRRARLYASRSISIFPAIPTWRSGWRAVRHPLPLNFDSPYKATSIIEFWRRWHMTLSRFLRDYLYIPLGGNRRGQVRRYANLMVTMLLGGLWHGAGWTFVLWGGLHGLYLVVNHAWMGLRARWPTAARIAAAPGYPLAALLLTQVSVVFAWVFFRADSFRAATQMIASMAGFAPAGVASVNSKVEVALIGAAYLVCFAAPNVNDMFAAWNVGIITYRNKSAPGAFCRSSGSRATAGRQRLRWCCWQRYSSAL